MSATHEKPGGRALSRLRRLLQRPRLRRVTRSHALRWGPECSPTRPVERVLFVCLGNICRSAFAAVAARSRLPGRTIESGGFVEQEGRPSPPAVVEAARELGVDLSAWRSTRLSAAQVETADLILAMDLGNLRRLAREFPAALPRVTLLGLFAPAGPAVIDDPWGRSPLEILACLSRILVALDGLAARLDAEP